MAAHIKFSDKLYLDFIHYSQKNNSINIPEEIEEITIQRIKNQLKNEFATYLFNPGIKVLPFIFKRH